MTATETTANSIPQTWNDQFSALKNRFPHVRDAILVAMHILTQNPDVTVEEAKAQANLLGVRITAASINGARTLMAKRSAATEPTATDASAPATTTAKSRAPRRIRAAEPAVDTEALIRQVVGKIQGQGNAEAERLREAVRRAIAVLQAAVA